MVTIKKEPIELAAALAEEFKRTQGRTVSHDDLDKVFKTMLEANQTALCFSGGGIRSATFGLGIVQALAKYNLLSKFDYLSTVSGGGYLGSWLSAWVLREQSANATRPASLVKEESEQPNAPDVIEEGSPGVDRGQAPASQAFRKLGIGIVQERINCVPFDDADDPNPEPKQLQHLREYSHYMSPKTGLLSADTWTLIAIYLRNLFLNLTIFLPLIAAVLIVPRFLFRMTNPASVGFASELVLLLGAIVMGSLAIAFVVKKLPSKNPTPPGSDSELGRKGERQTKDFLNTDAGVFLAGVVPLLLCAFFATTVWAWNHRLGSAFKGSSFLGFEFGPNTHKGFTYFLIASLAAWIVGSIAYLVMSKLRGFDLWGSLATLIASLVGGLLLWIVSHKLFDPRDLSDSLGSTFNAYEWQVYLCLAVPVFLLIVLIAATVFVGLSSKSVTDEDREWLARYGAWVLIVSCVWVVSNVLVLLGPSGLEWIFRKEWAELDFSSALPPALVSLIGILSGALSLLGGFSGKSLVRDEPIKTRTSKFLALAPKVAAVIFLGFIFVGIAWLTSLMIYAVGGLLPFGDFPASWDHQTALKGSATVYLATVLISLSVVGFVMACFVNVNKFSLHGAYRDRLVRAYLGASNPNRDQNTFTGFDGADTFQLHRLKDQRPFHIINATLNLVGGDNLAWQNRKAASFTMSPLHCGSWTLGYRHSNEYARNRSTGNCKDLDVCNQFGRKCSSTDACELPGKAIRLGTAMAISGAAANPNMGYYSSSVVTFLMSLFNIRLGWWLGNTGDVGSLPDNFGNPYYAKASPSIAVLPLLNEMLGRTDENKRYINVTDGGHFENLALYEMVLRRCRLIVLSDGAADRQFKFGEIANAIQKCKVDLGVDIRFLGKVNIRKREVEVEGKQSPTRSRFAIAEITYPENRLEKGYLIYTRPAYYGDEPADVKNYAECNEAFPHQSTGDQMYDEKQFEAYRGLGFATMEEIIRRLGPIAKPLGLIDEELIKLVADKPGLDRSLEAFFRDAQSLSGQWMADELVPAGSTKK